jgi:hypothetical protein
VPVIDAPDPVAAERAMRRHIESRGSGS